MKAGAGLVLALAIAIPAAARGDEMKLRTTGLPASAIAAGQNSAGALDEGRLALAGNNPAQAISAFHIALAQAPQSVAALNGLAVAYDRLGRSDLARQHFEMALALEPDAADIAYNLGLALVRAGQDRNAIPHLQRAAMGNDARAAATARRTLAQVAARLTMPPAPAAAAAGGPRIDIASSGEAVLVLAPTMPAAPAERRPAPTGLAAVEPALAARLGDTAALTIPMALAAAAPADTAMPAVPVPDP
ncbi:MAG: tetratricopeptide repeat protein, partial [Sandarakinorhabdus sp.]